DVKHIAETILGCSSISKPVSFSISGEEWTYGQGWVKNKCIYKHIGESEEGLNFHNFYGFGLVNAFEAVKLAKALKDNSSVATSAGLPLPSQEILEKESSLEETGLVVSTGSSPYVEDTLEISNSEDFIVESVQIEVSLEHAKSIGRLGVEIISPQGTRSILADVNNTYMFEDNNDDYLTLTSHAFYGERADGSFNGNPGEWKIRIVDGTGESSGVLKSWSIEVLGHKKTN